MAPGGGGHKFQKIYSPTSDVHTKFSQDNHCNFIEEAENVDNRQWPTH